MILKQEMGLRGEWGMRKVKWDLNMQECFLHAVRLIQISSNSLIHISLGQQKDCTDFTGFAVDCRNDQIIFSFLKSESVQSRKYYTTVSTNNSFLPTLTLCSNMLHLILNLSYFFFLWGKVAEISTLLGLCNARHSRVMPLFFYFSRHYFSRCGIGN